MRILWVEDQESQIKHFVDLLQEDGHIVIRCLSGEEVLDLMSCGAGEGEPYELVFLDVMLPKAACSRNQIELGVDGAMNT